MEYQDIMHMAIDHRMHEEKRLHDQMMRKKTKEFEDALADAMIYGSGVIKGASPQVSYSMAEIVLTDGTTQTFMMKASTNIIKHLLKEMRDTGYLTMWNDSDVLCIRADQVKQFALRAFTQQEK